MENRTWIGIIAVIIVILLAFWAYNSWKNQGPEEAVNNFYGKWIASSSSPLSGNAYRNFDDLTDNAKSKIDSVVRSFDGQGAYDPVLCAQDKPESFRVLLDSLATSTASATVYGKYTSGETPIKISLVKENQGWKIDDISCAFGGSSEILTKVGDYIKENISKLSPAKEVLGGKFYVTTVRLVGTSTALVNYEDGHNAYQAEAKFNISTSTGAVNITSFILDQENPEEPKG